MNTIEKLNNKRAIIIEEIARKEKEISETTKTYLSFVKQKRHSESKISILPNGRRIIKEFPGEYVCKDENLRKEKGIEANKKKTEIKQLQERIKVYDRLIEKALENEILNDSHEPNSTTNLNIENVVSEKVTDENDLTYYIQQHEKELVLSRRKRRIYSSWFFKWYKLKIEKNIGSDTKDQKSLIALMIDALIDFNLFDENKDDRLQANSAMKQYSKLYKPNYTKKKNYPSIEKNLPKRKVKQN